MLYPPYITVRIANKYNATILGKLYSDYFKMPEAYRLFRIGLEQDGDRKNREYIEKNGVLLNSVHELGSPENEDLIIKRIQSENPDLEDSKVLVLHENSSISKAVVKSAAFKKFILKWNMDICIAVCGSIGLILMLIYSFFGILMITLATEPY